MEAIKEIYLFEDTDITFDVLNKIERVVSLIADKESRSFDDVYADFMETNTYRAIQIPRSLMWYENSEFIVDEFYREAGKT